jgi:hypothetical protein
MLYRLGPTQYQWNGGLRVAISADTRKCVVFFGKLVPPKAGANSKASSEVAYGGTGFLAAYNDEGYTFRYLVTCRHVAKRLEDGFFLRLNTVAGGSEELPIDVDAHWQYHPDKTVDIAVTNIGINALQFDHFAVPLSKISKRENIGAGQRMHIVGLFRLHYGKRRNVPIVHTGHIAALADPVEKIAITDRTTGKRVLSEAYLVEAQTLEGLSGSPVFVQEYVAFPIMADGEGKIIATFGEVNLLGVYQGAWDGRPGEILETDRNMAGDYRIPVGMGMVVPIEKVIELIEGNDDLKKWREESKDQERASRAAITDSAFPAAPAKDANPQHREDFTSLLSAAARKQQSDD